MKLTNQEKEDLKISIQNENILLKRLRQMMMSFLMIAATALILGILVLKAWQGWQITAYVAAAVFGILSLMCFLSYQNGKKHLLKKIDQLRDSK